MNHNDALQVRSALKAGRIASNHSETQREAERPAVSMRKQVPTTVSRRDRLELLIVRAGLKAGRRARIVRHR
jgi:hypothetical protein